MLHCIRLPELPFEFSSSTVDLVAVELLLQWAENHCFCVCTEWIYCKQPLLM